MLNKDMKAAMKQKVLDSLVAYSADNQDVNAGWNLLRYWNSGYLSFNSNFHNADKAVLESIGWGKTKVEYVFLRAARAGMVSVNNEAFE